MSWGVFLVVVVGVLCIGTALGFGVSERLHQRELLWRWLLDRSERTVDDVAYRFGELWLRQLRLDPNSPDYDALENRIMAQREQLEHLGRAMVADEPALESNLRSTDGGPETEIIFVNCTGSEIAYYWMDQGAVEHYYGRVAPKSVAFQHTFEGHVWVAKNGAGEHLSVFRAVLPRSLAFVTLEVPTRFEVNGRIR